MSYKTDLQANNVNLQSILNTVNALPEAGSGDGIVPTGTKQITENGTYDVTTFASAEVNVPTGGSADHSLEDGIIQRSLSSYSNDRITTVGAYAFANLTALKSIDLPNVTAIRRNAFYGCSGLASIVFPKVKDIDTSAIYNCTKLQKADFYVLETLGAQVFQYSSALKAIIIRSPNVATLENTNAFTNMPVKTGSGYIYVPSALVDSYKAATNWSTYAAQIRAIEDYPDITGG